MEADPDSPASSPLRCYQKLLRESLAGSSEVSEVEQEKLLRACGRSPEDLERDLQEARERQRLCALSDKIPGLEARYLVAQEGLGVIREAGAKAREQARRREGKARRNCKALQRRLEAAKSAERHLKSLLSEEALKRWEDVESRLRELRALMVSIRSQGKHPEHIEAAIEQAERSLTEIRSQVSLAF